MARGGQGLVAESIEALRNMGLSGDDGQLLHLLKAADYNLERAVNFYLDGGLAAPPAPAPSSSHAGPSHDSKPPHKATPIQVHDESEEEEEGEEELEFVKAEGGAKGGARVCKHGQGPECAQCTNNSTHRSPCWPLVMGQRLVEGYSVGKGGALRQGETLHVTIDSGTSDRLGGSSGGGRGGKRKAATNKGRAAAVRFRSQGGVEGRLPSEVGALLMPLLSSSSGGGGALIEVHAEALYSLTRIEYFTKLPLLLRVSVCESFFRVVAKAIQAHDDLTPPPQSKRPPSALSMLGKAKDTGTQGKAAEALGAVREAAMALVCFLHTGKAEGVVEESGEKKRQKMISMASSSSSTGPSSGPSSAMTSATSSSAGPSQVAQGEVDVEGEGEEEGEARVEEGQLERLYRLNEQYNRQLPRYTPPIPALRGLELRDYQRQALQWMLQREEEPSDKPTPSPSDDDTKPAAQADDAGEAVLPMQGLVHAPASLSHRFPSHHELWDRHFLASLPPSPSHSHSGKGLVLGGPLVPYYVNVWSKRCQLTPPPPPKPCRGGILADDMGMGKTIMLLSLLLVSKQQQHTQAASEPSSGRLKGSGSGKGKTKKGGTLVVLPLSLMSQWRDELLSHTQHGALAVAFYYGTDRIPSTDYLRGVDVVLTTYGTLASEWSSFSSNRGTSHEGLYALHWTRVILDEAHTIKNKSTESSKAACGLVSDCRWCVTGTPIQNQLGDVFSLLRFLRHQPWDDATWWNKVIQEPFVRGDEGALDRLREVLGPMLLRRTKDATDQQGQRIVALPQRNVQLVEVEFSEAERDFYQALKDRSRVEFEGYVGSGAAMQAYAQILTLLLRLRQACDHPFLVLGRTLEARPAPSPLKQPQAPTPTPHDEPTSGVVGSTSITPAFLHSLFQRFTSGLGASPPPSTTTHAPAQPQQGQPKDDSEGGSGGGGKERGPSPAYFEALAQQLTSGEGLEGEECPLCLCSPMEEPVLTPCCHVMCRLCLRDTLRYKQDKSAQGRAKEELSGECPVCRRTISEADLVAITTQQDKEGEGKGEEAMDEGRKEEEGGKVEEEGKEKGAKEEASQGSGKGRPNGGELVLEGSAKMRRLVQELDRLVFSPVEEGGGKGLKAVVFSQWTHMLDLVAKVLTHKNWGHSRLDGSMSQVQRERALSDFNSRPECRVMVISLKAGGVGLNLTAASIVFLLDPWWNPAVEEQAIDRVHRLGQPQPVTHIFRFVVKDSVEQQMLEIQARKAQVAKHALARGMDSTQQDQGRINLEDFKRFFA